MATFKNTMKKEVPITNVEDWILLGNKKTVEVTLHYRDFPQFYPTGEPKSGEEKIVFLRGLSSYEFNTCLFDALIKIGDDNLTEYVGNAGTISLDPRNSPIGVNPAIYRKFIFELDYILVWKSMNDFHVRSRTINGQTFSMNITVDDVRKFEGIRKLAIVVYYLSGLTKDIPKQVKFFREIGAGETNRLAPLPSEDENNKETN